MNPFDLIENVLAEGMPPALVERARRIGDAAVFVEREGDVLIVEAFVTGGDSEAVHLEVDGGEIAIRATCGCGRAPSCFHVATALVAALAEDTRPVRTAASTAPPWQRDLEALLPPSGSAEPAELCVFLALETDGYEYRSWRRVTVPPRIVARLGTRGARGAWITGTADWRRYASLPVSARALRLVGELDRLTDLADGPSPAGGPREWRPLDVVPSRTLWSLLGELPAAGVPLLSHGKARHPVVLSDAQVEARLIATRHCARLQVSADLADVGDALAGEVVQLDSTDGDRVDDRADGADADDRAADDDGDGPVAAPLLIGSPAVAVARVDRPGQPDETIVLHQLVSPVSGALRELLGRPPISVDENGLAEFERSYLPRLRLTAPIVSPDESYDIPPAPEPVLVLDVRHAPRQTSLAWSWDRGFEGAAPDPIRETRILREVAAALEGSSGTDAAASGASAATDPAVPGSTPEPALPPDRLLEAIDTAVFVAETLPRLREIDGLRIDESGVPGDYRAAEAAPEVAVVATDGDGERDWFDLDVRVSVDGRKVDFSELLTALARGDEILLLPDGTYFPLQTPELIRLREIIAEAAALSDRPAANVAVSRYQVDLWHELTDLGVVTAQEAQWWLTVRSLRDSDTVVDVEPPPTLRAELRDYQRTGFSWLTFLRRHALGGVLADDMGLGKTLQTIAMMEQARLDEPDGAPFLIVAPTSVVGNWAAECARFAPDLVVRTVTATGARRSDSIAEVAAGAHVVVTSYALLRLEADEYAGRPWSGLVLDEAQQIKNPSSRGYRAARAVDAPFTLVVTGTPLENDLGELWALVSLACPGLLGSRRHFGDFFRTAIERGRDVERLRTLQRRLRPFLLRRTKDVVAAELPPKQEQVLEVDLHPTHRRLYDRRLNRERQKLLGLIDDVSGNGFQIFRSLTLLRQLALDPRLVDEGEAPVAKLTALVDLVREAAAEGHRVLVLSQFTRFLRSAQDAAEAAGLANVYLDGSTTDRQSVIDGFREGAAPVFFVSLKAGGFGLNLVEADYVVLLDPWWNPAVEAQAIDRTHRIGQTRPVFVYRLVARDTIEQKVLALQRTKAQLFGRVLDDDGALEPGTLTAEDIRRLVD